MSANLFPSEMQLRLRSVFAPYVRLLNLDPDETRYYLTHGDYDDVDHRVEYLTAGQTENDPQAWQTVLPQDGFRGGLRFQRQQSLADVLAYFGSRIEEDPDNENRASAMAQAIARHLVNHRELDISQLRSRRHTLQSPEAVRSMLPDESDPNSELYFDEIYRVSVIVDNGRVSVLKRTATEFEAGAAEVQP